MFQGGVGGGEKCHRGQTQKLRGQILCSSDTGGGGRQGGGGGYWVAAKWHAVTGFKAS